MELEQRRKAGRYSYGTSYSGTMLVGMEAVPSPLFDKEHLIPAFQLAISSRLSQRQIIVELILEPGVFL